MSNKCPHCRQRFSQRLSSLEEHVQNEHPTVMNNSTEPSSEKQIIRRKIDGTNNTTASPFIIFF